ncbi:MAG: hypothetical protein WAK98_09005 [Gemmobacter sp.]
MAQDPIAQANAEHEAVLAQMSALRSELSRLAQEIQTTTLSRGQAFARDMSDGMTNAASYLGRKGHGADQRLGGAVAANPYLALGLAAGMGILVGALTRRHG